jgi:FHA domain
MASRPSDDGETRQTALPTPTPEPDEQSTRAVEGVGIVAELKAVTETGEKKTLPLYALPDAIILGRGSAAEWQIEDSSLSRKHAQFKWNGRELTVEDLGSANGTRVGARPARVATAVKPGDKVQCGTVMIAFELRGQAQHHAGETAQDAEATRLVTAPAPSASESSYTPAPLTAAPTVVRAHPAQAATPPSAQSQPYPLPGPYGEKEVTGKPHAAVFRPERDAARPDEPTRPWDPRAALVHAPEKAIDASELIARLKNAWKTNRRPFVLGGAVVWIGILLIVWQVATRPPAEEDAFPGAPRASATRRPELPAPAPGPSSRGQHVHDVNVADTNANPGADTNANPGADTNAKPGADTNANPGADTNANPPAIPDVESDRDDVVAQAVAAYDQGRMSEALMLFKKLAADPKDSAARFMVELIESRSAQGAP